MQSESSHRNLPRPLSSKARALVAVLLISGTAGLVHLAAISGAQVSSTTQAVDPPKAVRAEQHRRAVFEERRKQFDASRVVPDKAAQARE